ncbi:MAG: hypothetical protein EX260_08705 [Desulfobulbaceae bacterium]|nr:MAG: hypothetical protein EX260_08705 [Desulfobulbaceae bacterium]
MFTIIQVSKSRHRVKRVILNRLKTSLKALKGKPHKSDQPVTESETNFLSAEEKSKVELESLHQIIEDRKQLAMDLDLSHHLWNLYKNHFRFTSTESLDPFNQEGAWYGVKIVRSSANNNLYKFEFELNGVKYTFVDDEENRNWSDNLKYFSLFLYDESGRCLIEVTMKVRVDQLSREYSVVSGGPKAFLPGGWTKDFINATLIHQSMRNKEIRAQKHQERLWEIEELKNRFGISD